MSRPTPQGFTIIEILITLAILAIIVALLVNSFQLFSKHQEINKDADIVIEALEEARTNTLASQNASQYGVHFATSSVTIFAGSTYVAGASTNVSPSLTSSATVLTRTLTGGGNDVVFQRLTGETAQNGTIGISSPNTTRTRTVTIYKTGLIE
jgi:prepilin-type N-terminal cleavage/methylation domain-containing protein